MKFGAIRCSHTSQGCADQFFKDNKIKSLPDNHYGSDAHRQLVDGWLSRQIPNYVLK